jgi:outer membrane protein insertion porin family
LVFAIFFCLAAFNASAQDESSQASESEVSSAARDIAQAQKRSGRALRKAAPAKVSQDLIKEIKVEGQKKIEADAVIAKLKSQVGQKVSRETLRADLVSLFETGFFADVRISQKNVSGGVELTYTVVEKPSITEILVEGNSEVKTEEILEAAGLKAFEILNMGRLKDATEKVLKIYEDKGFFLARVDAVVEDVTKNEQVKVRFKIQENEKVKVRQITFLGNRKLKDVALKGNLQTNEEGFFSFLSDSGAFKQDAFDRDVQRLRFIYFNQGYVQVKIDRPQVYVTPDKRSMYITIRIEEGEQFDIGEIDFAGDLLFPRDELVRELGVDKQTTFSYELLQKDLATLQAKYGDLGYAFANVIPRTRINERDRKVDVTFEFDKGSKVYFGRINVVGNSKTRDKVVRRELRIREGELYNETRRRQSLERIQRLGFFEEVVFKTSTPAEQPDVLNIDISVKERNTGSIQLGAGYGSATGFNLNGQVNQSNFLGKGQRLGAGLNISRDTSTYNLNFTEPYFRDTEWSLGFDVYQSFSRRLEYNEKKVGGAVRAGHPLSDDLFGSLRYKLDQTDLEAQKDSSGNITTDTDLYPLETASGITSSLTGTLEFDQRNDRFSPSKGIYASVSLEYAGLGGDLQYTKGSSTFRYFKKVFWEVVWRNNLSYSFISAQDDGVEPPFNELYLLGGPYSLRGYRFFRVGRTKFSQKAYNDAINAGATVERANLIAQRPYGGTQQVLYQTEFEFPLIAEAGIRGVAFYDIGQAEDEIISDNFYSNVGFGFRWFSPIGPLRFEWGFPLKKLETSPDPVVFDFSIGSPF